MRSRLNQTGQTIRDVDATRKREARSESARIEIPDCKNIKRREQCLADPERFLRTYFPDRYTLRFERDHRFIIEAVIARAMLGGRQAIGAPRSRGKTETCRGILVYLILKGLVRFPLSVASTTQLASKTFRDLQKKFATNNLLLDDFPEVCYPVRALDGAPQRAGRQHIDGQPTGIIWTQEAICFPRVETANAICKTYGGVKVGYYGLDAAFRGLNVDGDRPDFVLVDDPETRESARSHSQSEDREEILDRDIAGLAGQENSMAIVVLTTVQNDYSLSFRLTAPEIKPSWNGVRFRLIEKWPEHSDMWQRYIELRHDSQRDGDPNGREAVEYYVENRAKMDTGCEMLTEHFVEIVGDDGYQFVRSAIQQAYNKIADTSLEDFQTEFQNDPPKSSMAEGNGLTWDLVASRNSTLPRYQVPGNATALTAAIDLGKYRCHWVVIAWVKGAAGTIIDYGVADVSGTEQDKDISSSEPKIYQALLNWRDELLAKEYVDTSEEKRKIDLVMVDSGAFTNAAYEFVRQSRGPFLCSKGYGNYRAKKQSSSTLTAGLHLHKQYLDSQKIWLHELDVDYWKQFVHERFLTPTFDDKKQLRRGSLSLFAPTGSIRHTTFANHIVAEELVEEFIEGKGIKRRWAIKTSNNHWLDATCMAAACTEILGIHLLNEPTDSQHKVQPVPVASDQEQKPAGQQRSNPRFRHRQGGWMQSIRRK